MILIYGVNLTLIFICCITRVYVIEHELNRKCTFYTYLTI